MSRFISALPALAALAFTSATHAASPRDSSAAHDATSTDQPPNILIIVSDDHGFADASFLGSEIKTPNIDRLAEEGAVLNQFYVTPVCTPTRAGLLTGRWPIRFGLHNAVIPPWRDRGLPKEEVTIAEILAEAGYRHRAVIGKWHLGHHSKEYHPREQGFTHFYGLYNGGFDYFTHEREGELDWHRNDEPVVEEGYATDLLCAESVQFIEDVPDDEPYFLYLPFNAPHGPLHAKEGDLAKYPDLEGDRRTYAAMVDSMDQAIGKVLDAAEKRGDLDNTFVLFFSDNGGQTEHADNGPRRDGKYTLYQGGIRSLAVARWPDGGISGGKHIDERMGYIDVLPTLLNVAGVKTPPPQPLDGIDVLDAMRGEQSLPDREWFNIFTQFPEDDQRPRAIHSPGHSVQTDDWKLITRGPVLHTDFLKKGTIELYRWPEDPLERNNLAPEYPEVVKELLESIRSFRRAFQRVPLMPAILEGKEGFVPPENWAIPE